MSRLMLSNSSTEQSSLWRPYPYESHFNTTITLPVNEVGTYEIEVKTGLNAAERSVVCTLPVEISNVPVRIIYQFNVGDVWSEDKIDHIMLRLGTVNSDLSLTETGLNTKVFSADVGGFPFSPDLLVISSN